MPDRAGGMGVAPTVTGDRKVPVGAGGSWNVADGNGGIKKAARARGRYILYVCNVSNNFLPANPVKETSSTAAVLPSPPRHKAGKARAKVT